MTPAAAGEAQDVVQMKEIVCLVRSWLAAGSFPQMDMRICFAQVKVYLKDIKLAYHGGIVPALDEHAITSVAPNMFFHPQLASLSLRSGN